MKKDDHLRIHALLYQVRVHLEQQGAPPDAFLVYDAHGVTPQRIERDHKSHLRAIGLLGEAISKIVSPTKRLYFITRPEHAMSLADITLANEPAPFNDPTEARRAERRVEHAPTTPNAYPPPSEWGTRIIRTELTTS